MSLEIDKNLRYKILDLADDWKTALYDVALQRKEPALASEFKIHMWDAESINILAIILATAYKNQKDHGVDYLYARIALEELAKKRRNTLKYNAVNKRLWYFARAWFFNVDTSAQKINGKHQTQLIYLHQSFNTIFKSGGYHLRKNFLRDSAKIYLSRPLKTQGFRWQCPYGSDEADPKHHIIPVTIGEHTNDKAEKVNEKTQQSKEENKLWRAYKIEFIQQAAKCWIEANARIGNPHTIPVWSDMANTGAEVARMRRSLTKMFESMGGTVTALAWYVYTHGMPALKPDGSLVFDLKIPHRQFRSSDMKPEGFAKHFNAILLDHDFRYLAGPGWHKGKDFLLRHFSREILEVGPRDGKYYADKLGYVLGDNPISNPPTENV